MTSRPTHGGIPRPWVSGRHHVRAVCVRAVNSNLQAQGQVSTMTRSDVRETTVMVICFDRIVVRYSLPRCGSELLTFCPASTVDERDGLGAIFSMGRINTLKYAGLRPLIPGKIMKFLPGKTHILYIYVLVNVDQLDRCYIHAVPGARTLFQ